MSKRKILVIENQITQFETIRKNLDEYEIYPALEEYELIMNLVCIRLNKRYIHDRRTEALTKLREYIVERKIELFIIDYKLSGCHDGLTGIDLAFEIQDRSLFPKTPVIFLSRSSSNTKEIKDHLINVENKWVEKGYAGLSLLEPSYFEKYIKTQIIIAMQIS